MEKSTIWHLREWLRVGFFVTLLLFPQIAHACITSADFDMKDIREADAIFSGSVLSYEIVSPGRPESLDDYGLITVRVKESLKGEISGDVQLYWWNSTFGIPEQLSLTDPALFAAVSAEKNGLPLRGGSATIFPSRRPDLLQVLQAPCSGAFILPYAKGSAESVRKILDGESVDYFNNYSPEADVTFRTITATNRVERAMSIVMVAGVFGLCALVACIFWIWLRRKRRVRAIAKS